jgi:hypothetical protein
MKEAFSRVKPNIGHLRIFGCPIYIHVPMKKRMNLEPLGKKCIFLVYNETSKAYEILIPAKRKTIVNKYVNFEEKLTSSRSQESSTVTNDKE